MWASLFHTFFKELDRVLFAEWCSPVLAFAWADKVYSGTSINGHLIKSVVTNCNAASIAGPERPPYMYTIYCFIKLPIHFLKDSFHTDLNLAIWPALYKQLEEHTWTFDSASFSHLEHKYYHWSMKCGGVLHPHTLPCIIRRGDPWKESAPIRTQPLLSPLRVPFFLCIQCILWKSDSSQYICWGIWYKYVCLRQDTIHFDLVVDIHAVCINDNTILITHLYVYILCSKAILCHKGANCFVELTLYSGHLIIAANRTWPIGGWVSEVPQYK